ncbi:MAG: nucleotidyltransferase domain-containing protein [Alphaproteobacteria bacterium]|nr:nucleotidyltransferase domain-containing protein [Alphaproteobacteria bacterium SS10]
MSQPKRPPYADAAHKIGPPDFSTVARRTFQRFIDRRFGPDAVIFLGGSVQRGDARFGSDVDAVVVLPKKPGQHRQRIKQVIEGVPIDLAVYNLEGLQTRLGREKRAASPWVMEIVGEGEVVTNPRSPTARIARTMARRHLREGPPEFKQGQRRPALVEISELTESLAGSTDTAEMRFLGAMLMPKLATFHLRDNDQWIGRNRGLLTRLKAFDPDYAEALDKAVYVDLGQKGDIRPLVELTKQTLAAAGGLARDLPLDIDPDDPASPCPDQDKPKI